jgi:hypothetical protein
MDRPAPQLTGGLSRSPLPVLRELLGQDAPRQHPATRDGPPPTFRMGRRRESISAQSLGAQGIGEEGTVPRLTDRTEGERQKAPLNLLPTARLPTLPNLHREGARQAGRGEVEPQRVALDQRRMVVSNSGWRIGLANANCTSGAGESGAEAGAPQGQQLAHWPILLPKLSGKPAASKRCSTSRKASLPCE